jgi:hypothetical protein
LGLAVTLIMYRSDWIQPVLAQLAGPPTAERPLPLRRFDPTCRLRGWRTLTAEIDRLRDVLRAEEIEPILAGSSWGLPGEIAFYCRGNPTVYSLGLALGDRHSQYDLWQPNPIADPEVFAGKTFIFVGEITDVLRSSFEQIDSSDTVLYRESGQPIGKWTVTVCRGFKGFSNAVSAGSNRLF